MGRKKLPVPRLQLRWMPGESDERWECHYELVIPLDKYDIRREVWKNGRQLKREVAEIVIPLEEPTLRNSWGTPCMAQDGTRYCDAPYRAGCHALWDAKKLGNLPVFVIAIDGKTFEHKQRADVSGEEGGSV